MTCRFSWKISCGQLLLQWVSEHERLLHSKDSNSYIEKGTKDGHSPEIDSYWGSKSDTNDKVSYQTSALNASKYKQADEKPSCLLETCIISDIHTDQMTSISEEDTNGYVADGVEYSSDNS